MNCDRLMAVLETDSEDGLMELAAERIRELGSETVEKQKVIDKLEKDLAYAKEKQRLLDEKEELKKKIEEQKAKNAELDKEEKRLQGILQDSMWHERKLFQMDSSDSEIGKLKLARMNLYQRAHGLTEDNNPRLLGNRPVVVDTITPRKRLCNDGLDPLVDELKAKRMRIFEDSRAK